MSGRNFGSLVMVASCAGAVALPAHAPRGPVELLAPAGGPDSAFAAFHFGYIRLWPPQRARKLGLRQPTFFSARDQDLAQCLFEW